VKTREFQAAIARHSWPGNVRELRNYVERCLALAEQAPLDEEAAAAGTDLEIDTSVPLKTARDRWTAIFERRYLEKVLEQNGGNVSAAARAASVDRIHFYRLLWRNGLK
jgi:two-component system, NtrC family, response regulator GlrR